MEIGTTLSQYRITAKLGEGGMGEVYRAEDTRLKRAVAIKVLPAELAADPERLARLEREAQVLAQLEHPNVAAIYGLEEAVPEPPSAQLSGASESGAETEAGAADPVRFLVMQLADGDTLDVVLDRRGGVTGSERVSTGAVTAVPLPTGADAETAPIRERGLSLDDALAIAGAIAAALEAAHDEGIVHRDLKPANIMVAFDDGAPQVKVLDFGLATVYQPDSAADVPGDQSASPTMIAATNAGVIMGTAGYMSPEQARGQRVDQRSDIWAFGVVLYEMLTGRRLFSGGTLSDTLAAVLKDEIDFGALPAQTPVPIRRLLRRCLQRDPRRRIRDIADARLEIDDGSVGLLGAEAADVAAILKRGDVELATGEAVEAGPKKATLTWIHAVAAVALVGTGVAITLLAMSTFAPMEQPVRTFGDLGPAAARSAVISPDGTKLALDIGNELWVRDFDTLTPRRIEGSEGVRSRPLWSPDSSRLAFFVDGDLYVASVSDGASRRIGYDAPIPSRWGAAWAPDGIIVAGERIGELVMLSPDGGDLRVVARARGTGFLRFPTILPDGETLVYEFSERGEGNLPSSVVMLQRGLDVDAEVETILEVADSLAGFHYSEELEILLVEGVSSGLWALPLSSPGYTSSGTLERFIRNGEDMSLSDDGTFVYRAIPDPLESKPFRWIDRGGGVLETIESGKDDPRWISVSPDGTRVAFEAQRAAGLAYDVWVRDLVRGAETRITAEPGAGGRPDWRGNEQLLLLGPTLRGSGASAELFTQAASGAGGPDSIAAEALFRSPIASLDGRYIVFEALVADGELQSSLPAAGGRRRLSASAQRGGRGARPGGGSLSGFVWNLYYLVDGEDGPQLYRGADDNQMSPALSPDGGRIAFISDASGSSEVWVDTFPEPSEQVRISVSGGGYVRWSPKGGEIFYDDGAGTLWSVFVDTGVNHGREAYLQPTRLFEQGDVATRFDRFGNRDWDVGPTGETFLTVQQYAEGISPVNVIVNFPRWYRERR